MTKEEFETWLRTRADGMVRALTTIVDVEQSAVHQLERQLEIEPSADVVRVELDALASEARALEKRIATLHEAIADRCERLLIELSESVSESEAAARAAWVHDLQQLFDELAPGDLSQPIEHASRNMLERDLRRSTLPRALQTQLEESLAACRVLLTDDSSVTVLNEVQETHAALTAEIRALEMRLRAHDVAPALVEGLEQLRDPRWFLEEVVEIYAGAAEAEAAWRLPRKVFKELGLES